MTPLALTRAGRTSGRTEPQDPITGPLNATGLYGTNHGWDLPGYPDGGWQSVSLPDDWNSRGVPVGVGWYRTTFSLAEPSGRSSRAAAGSER